MCHKVGNSAKGPCTVLCTVRNIKTFHFITRKKIPKYYNDFELLVLYGLYTVSNFHEDPKKNAHYKEMAKTKLFIFQIILKNDQVEKKVLD